MFLMRVLCIIIILTLVCLSHASIGDVSTGTGGSPGSRLNYPTDVYVDSSVNMYIADMHNHVIRKIDVSGVITTVAGTGGLSGFNGDNGPANSARLSYPYGVFADSSENIYIADKRNHIVRKVDKNGVITTVAGTGGLSGFSGDNGPATSAKLNKPSGVYVDSSGNMYIADMHNHAIRKVDVNGVITTVAGTGLSGFSGDNGPATIAKLNTPHGVYVDSYANMYIADSNNHVIRKVDVNGVITSVVGIGRSSGFSGDGGLATSAKLSYPNGVYVDSYGNMYIAEKSNHVIRKVDVSGVITTVAGTGGLSGFNGDNGPATSAKLSYPNGVYVDSSGDIYIADSVNQVVRKVGVNGVITTVAGTARLSGFSGDNGPATSARLSYPNCVVVDTTGNLITADKADNGNCYASRHTTAQTSETNVEPPSASNLVTKALYVYGILYKVLPRLYVLLLFYYLCILFICFQCPLGMRGISDSCFLRTPHVLGIVLVWLSLALGLLYIYLLATGYKSMSYSEIIWIVIFPVVLYSWNLLMQLVVK